MNQVTETGQMYGQTVTVRRITKKEARALFCAGIQIFMQSCNMRPFGPWQSLCPVELDQERINSSIDRHKWHMDNGYEVSPSAELTAGIQFNNVVNEFEYYNCDSERGRYAAFYCKVSNNN